MEIRNPFVPRAHEEYRLAEKLRSLRAYRGLTQKQVADIAGIDESTVRNYELARRVPQPEHVHGLARALEVMPESLMLFNEYARPNDVLRMFWVLIENYGFKCGVDDEFAYLTPTKEFFVTGLDRWAYAYGEMSKDEEAYRVNYDLWKDEFHDHFEKADYPAIYPAYDPLDSTAAQRWESDRFAKALKAEREYQGLTQEQLAEKSGISMFTIRSYEQGKRMPRKKQLEALREALGLSSAALTSRYFGSPNQTMHYLFLIAFAANMTPVNTREYGSVLRTNGNMTTWSIIKLNEELEKVETEPTPENQDAFKHWLNTADMECDVEIRKARKAGVLTAKALTKLPPTA